MEIVRTHEEVRRVREEVFGTERVAFIPTMGALHEGHLSLVRAARRDATHVVVSIFVNPTQFAPNEDFSLYPRTLERDLALLRDEDVALVYCPNENDLYPPRSLTRVLVDDISKRLCGRTRPTHFQGVTTIVAKLFNIVRPTVAYFGEKDFQQLAIIKQMTRDLNIPVIVKGAPIVREPDGLARSSRNVYLSEEERKDAVLLFRALQRAQTCFSEGVYDVAAIRETVDAVLAQGKTLFVDYIALVDSETLDEAVETVTERTRVLLAVYAGKTRLIDNAPLADIGR